MGAQVYISLCKVFCNHSGSTLESNKKVKATNREPLRYIDGR